MSLHSPIRCPRVISLSSALMVRVSVDILAIGIPCQWQLFSPGGTGVNRTLLVLGLGLTVLQTLEIPMYLRPNQSHPRHTSCYSLIAL